MPPLLRRNDMKVILLKLLSPNFIFLVNCLQKFSVDEEGFALFSHLPNDSEGGRRKLAFFALVPISGNSVMEAGLLKKINKEKRRATE